MPPLDWMDARALESESDAANEPQEQAAAAAGGPIQAADPGLAARCLEGLNEPQAAAVCHAEGPLLILAGAGSGKTRVITRRIAWLVASGRAAPHEILAITFTNKAAQEMRERVESLLPIRGMWISTFHSMCARLLRRDIGVLGERTRDFSIYDTHDRNLLLKGITKDLGFDVQHFRPALVGSWISTWKTSRRVGAAAPKGAAGFEEEVLVQVRDRYLRAMRENNALDFDDLLLETLRIFEEHPGVRDAYAHRFRFALVDEYQDTNRTQYLLTRHFASHHGNLAVCGDPDQSIYGWRGADVGNILDFERDFGGGEAGVHVVKLEQNYRSTQPILKSAQGLIRHNVGRKEKDLWTEKEGHEPVGVVSCADENDEASFIAGRIQTLCSQGFRSDQMAIFYRANFMQRALERALRLSGVPYQIVGGVEFYRRREIRDLIGYLQLAVNPRDDVACRRVLNVPGRGIGEKSVATLMSYAVEHGLSLLQAASSETASAELRGRAKAGVRAFATLLENFGGYAERPAEDALHQVLEATDYLAWLRSSGDAEAQARIENVEELVTHAETFDRDNPAAGLRGFLQDVALVSDVDGMDENAERVALMTLHSSKGLEFPVVFICGLEEELLPHALALSDAQEEADGVEEERRLLYVGMTRAQERLFLLHAQTRFHYGQTAWRMPSRFLEELPGDWLAGGAVHEGLQEEAEAEVLGGYDPPQDVPQLRQGDRVRHGHFGLGYVQRLQGSGVNARVTVDFQQVGSKVLLVQYARLEVVTG